MNSESLVGEIWRGGARTGESRKSSPMRKTESNDWYSSKSYAISVDTVSKAMTGYDCINISGNVDAGRGQSDISFCIKPEGFAAILRAMMRIDANATWAAMRAAATNSAVQS